MRVAVFSIRAYELPYLVEANEGRHDLLFLDAQLGQSTSSLAAGCPAVALFANDCADGPVLRALAVGGTHLVCLRSAGFNHVDLVTADALGLTVLRVPAYSPYAVAEHTFALVLALNRKIHRAWSRVREHDFRLDGLVGFDLHNRTLGIVGTGRIGEVVARIAAGFGCRVLASDPVENPGVLALGGRYVPFDALCAESDIITLHCPLTPATRHLVDAAAIAQMKRGVVLVNTSRGAVVDSQALLGGLKSGKLGGAALDVYEEEGDLFFRDLSDQVLRDEVFARLLTFPNVLVTAHQGFLTTEALAAIARTTLANLDGFAAGAVDPANRVTAAAIR